MAKVKRSKAKKESLPTDVYEVFPGLRFTINYSDIVTVGLPDKRQAFTLSTVDDAEDVHNQKFEDIQMVCNRSFTYKEALKLSAALAEAIKAVDVLKKQYSKLDEIDCYLDSMQSTVDDYRRELKEDAENIDVNLDLDGDLKDLEYAIENF
jgi:hypothetical protein